MPWTSLSHQTRLFLLRRESLTQADSIESEVEGCGGRDREGDRDRGRDGSGIDWVPLGVRVDDEG